MALNVGELSATLTLDTKKTNKSIQTFGKRLDKMKKKIKDVGKTLPKIDLKKFGNTLKKTGSNMTKFGKSMTKNVTAPILGVATATLAGIKAFGNYADSLLDLEAQTGISTDDLQKMRQVERELGIETDSLARSSLELTKGLFNASGGAGKSAKALEELGINIKDNNGNLKSGNELTREAIKELGTMTDKTKRNSLAQKIFGANYETMLVAVDAGIDTFDNAIKKAEELGLVLDKETLQNANNARIELETLATVLQTELFNALGDLIPLFSETFVPMLKEDLIPLIQQAVIEFGKLTEKFFSMDEKGQKMALTIGGILLVLGPLITALGVIIKVGGVIISLISAIGAPIALLIAGIGLLVVAFIKNFDKIQEKTMAFSRWFDEVIASIADFAVEKFYKFRDGLHNAINSAQQKFSDFINRIKGFFRNLKLKIPEIKLPRLPKVRVTGKFSLTPPQVPKFHFFQRGGIVDRPTFAGLGERGREAVVPLAGSAANIFAKTFLDRLQGLSGGFLGMGGGITVNVNGDVKDPQKFAMMISREIEKETRRKTRARGR